MTEIEKQPQPPAPAPRKSSEKLATFLSSVLESPKWKAQMEELPWLLRKAMEMTTTWVRAHKHELAEAGDDDALDLFLAQYADMMLTMRSDDAPTLMRVIGFAGHDALESFNYFQEHFDEIRAVIERKALEPAKAPAENDGEPRTEGPRHQTPGGSPGQTDLDKDA